MSEFTKTEWLVDGLTVYALDADGVENEFSCLLQPNGNRGATYRELEANAKLMSAAPDMYRVIKYLVEHECINDPSMFKEADLALFKADGVM